jgi:glycosyltransferase involved in cell wall biosynthesis
VVGLVGRLAPWKGQHVFLDAFARAFPTGGVRARIVGDALFGEDAYRDSLHQQVVRLGITDRVEFRGFRSDVRAELAALDVLVHASVQPEPFGQVVVEGMAAGLPVIATDAGGPAEIIDRGVDGLLIPPDDVEALAAAMRLLVGDLARRDDLGRRARVSATRYRADAIVPRFAELYDDVGAAQ